MIKVAIAFFALIYMSSSALAIHWEGRAGRENNDWNIASNWSENNIPTSDDEVLALMVPGFGPAISSSGAIGHKLHVSLWGWDGELTITSTGSLSLDYETTIGHGADESGTLNNSGSLNTGSQLAVGINGEAVLNMYAGQINVGGDLQVATESGKGYINLQDGTIIANGIDVNTNGNAMINISDGELLIDNINPFIRNSLISDGQIIAYGGWGSVHYSTTVHSGYTTFYATDSNPPSGYVDWDNGGISNSWDMPINWNIDKTPRSMHNVRLTSDTSSRLNCPIISEGLNVSANTIIIGNGASEETPKLKMTGGNLETISTIYVGHETKGAFLINGGEIQAGGIISGHFGGDGRIDISDGNITATNLIIGHESGSESLVRMTGGSLSLNSITIGLLSGAGRLELCGGTIEATSLNISLTTSTLDITNGKLILDGNATATIQGYIASGILTGYGDSANIVFDYNETYSGKTTITATSGKPCSQIDLSGDCLVDFEDATIFASQWLNNIGCSGYDCADYNNDLDVDNTDLASIASQWLISPELPRIAAQANVSNPKFYNTQTGATFTPTGSNYIPLDWVDGIPYHTTFNTAHYDSDAAEEALSKMQRDGYNVVRVFLDRGDPVHQNLGEYSFAGQYSRNVAQLYQPCVDDFIDFLRRARSHNIYVIPTCDFFPNNQYYWDVCGSDIPANVDNMNILLLSQGGISAKKIYLEQLVQSVKDAEPNGALLSTVFSWELTNEVAIVVDGKPFKLESGLVTTADGQTYDMAIDADRQQCLDSNIVNWANQCVAAVNAVDPEAMISVSVYTYSAVNRTGPNGVRPITYYPEETRFPARPLILLEYSTLDYVDVHTYPNGSDYSFTDDLASSEYSTWNQTKKPLLMGEYGAHINPYPSIEEAAEAMISHRDQARTLGFEGELFWTWQYNGQNQLWHMLQEGGAINDALK